MTARGAAAGCPPRFDRRFATLGPSQQVSTSLSVMVANAIAWPVAWYYLHDWLQGFAYRITLSPVYFLGAGMIALAIAWATVFVHALRVARANPKLGTPIVESVGTGGGFKLFCAGVGERFPDISNASRRMKASEAKQCAANGVKDVTEIQVGLDGLALATSKSTGLAGVTQKDIYMALAKTPYGKPQKAKTWKDVNPKLPAIAIRVYGPPPTSGTPLSISSQVFRSEMLVRSQRSRSQPVGTCSSALFTTSSSA